MRRMPVTGGDAHLITNHKRRITKRSRNERNFPQHGMAVGRTSKNRPPDKCQRQYEGCEGDVMVSIRNPETPHIYIRMCGNCALIQFNKAQK